MLDSELETYFAKNHPDCWVLNIQNIASFYNYRTVGDDFRLVTSVLSDQDALLDIRQVKSNGLQHIHGYQVVDEVVLKEEDMTSKLRTLTVKKARINSAMLKIRIAHI